MADLNAFYRVRLNEELQKRTQKNSRYSIRSFARNLGIDNGQLSKLLSGKLLLSLDLAGNIVRKLGLESDERKQFILSAAEEQQCHALYLMDPTLTDCDPKEHKVNALPPIRRKKKLSAEKVFSSSLSRSL